MQLCEEVAATDGGAVLSYQAKQQRGIEDGSWDLLNVAYNLKYFTFHARRARSTTLSRAVVMKIRSAICAVDRADPNDINSISICRRVSFWK